MANEKLLKLLRIIADSAQSVARMADTLRLDVLFECGVKMCEEERENLIFDLEELAGLVEELKGAKV